MFLNGIPAHLEWIWQDGLFRLEPCRNSHTTTVSQEKVGGTAITKKFTSPRHNATHTYFLLVLHEKGRSVKGSVPHHTRAFRLREVPLSL